MKRTAYILALLLSAVLLVVLTVAGSVEKKTVTGQSSTASPDGNWSLRLQLVEYSTLLKTRKVLDADLVHKSRRDWDVNTSIELPHADAIAISNQHPDHPVIWSDDSSVVSYWINAEHKDTIRIEANDQRHVFQRELSKTHVIFYPNKIGG
jgi:hypothetical protein